MVEFSSLLDVGPWGKLEKLIGIDVVMCFGNLELQENDENIVGFDQELNWN